MNIDFKLSIVIPYYNTYELTKKLLDRLIPQLTEETELIVIDDGCHEERLNEYLAWNVKIVHLEENTGGAHATNEGIDRTTGRYVALIDSDDLVSSEYVETLLNVMDMQDKDLIYFDWHDLNTGKITRHPKNYAPWKCIYRREIMPRFVDGWIYSFDVPFQEEINKIPHTEFYIDRVLYYYNSNRPGNLTQKKAEAIRKANEEKGE